MSSVLDIVNSFSSTLSGELAAAVKDQDAATVEAFTEISTRIGDARQAFLTNLKAADDAFNASVKTALEKRSLALKEAGAILDGAILEVEEVISTVRARYE